MLTPRFTLSQDDDNVVIEARCPYIKTQDVEIDIDGAHFRLYVKPYFLKIEFPGNLVEDGREHAAYDVASGLLRIQVPKATPGEQFENLNLLTQLGVNSRMQNLDAQPPAKGPLIEELDAGALDADSDDLVDEDFDWSFTPDLAPDDGIDGSLSSPKYGFNNQYSGVFVGFDAMETLRDIIDMGHPEVVLREFNADELRQLRQRLEDDKFDDEHFMHDCVFNDEIQMLIDWKPWWQSNNASASSVASVESVISALNSVNLNKTSVAVEFTHEERDLMLSLPQRAYLFDSPVTLKQHYLSLVSILYAYVYDVRINMGDTSVESAWTMCKLSPTLSWLEHPQSMPELVETLLRRTMCYPLYRHWALTVTCLRDVAQLLVSGRAAVVKALLHVLAMLRKHEDGWRIGRIWLEDYAAWVQQPETTKGAVRASLLFSLAQDLLKICTQLDQHPVRFEIAGWNLAQLEQYAHELHQDDEDAAGDSSSSSGDSCESESSNESDAE